MSMYIERTEEVKTVPEMLVWKVQDGPYCLDDLPEPVQEIAEGWPFRYWLVVMATHDNSDDSYDTEVWFETFEDAYGFAEDVKKSMEPIEIKDESYEDDQN